MGFELLGVVEKEHHVFLLGYHRMPVTIIRILSGRGNGGCCHAIKSFTPPVQGTGILEVVKLVCRAIGVVEGLLTDYRHDVAVSIKVLVIAIFGGFNPLKSGNGKYSGRWAHQVAEDTQYHSQGHKEKFPSTLVRCPYSYIKEGRNVGELACQSGVAQWQAVGSPSDSHGKSVYHAHGSQDEPGLKCFGD